MDKRKINILIFIILSLALLTTIQSKNCEPSDQSLECLILKDYPESLDDQLACQLCAVVLQTGFQQYQQKADRFCLSQDKQNVRNCGLTSFAYLLLKGNFLQAFKAEYMAFYKNPFQHQQRVTNILKKQTIRSKLISWLQEHFENEQPHLYFQRAIANLYLQDLSQCQNQLNEFMNKQNSKQFINQVTKLQSRIMQKQGRFNEALNFVNKQIQILQKFSQNQNIQVDPYVYHLKGNFLMHHLKFQAAIKQFQKANKLFISKYHSPEFRKGFKFSKYNKGLCYQKLNRLSQAIKIYTEIIQTATDDVQVLNALGSTYVQIASETEKIDINRLRKGIFYLQQAVNLQSLYYIAHYNLGYAYLKENKLDKAIESFNESIKIKITSQAIYGLISVYLITNDFKKINQLISQNLNIDESIEDILSLYYEFGDIQTKQNKQFYHEFISKNHDKIKSAKAFYWIGMIEIRYQNYHEAIKSLQVASDLGYNQAHLLFNLAYCYQSVGQFDQAIHYYNKSNAKQYRKQTKQRIQYCKKMINKVKKSQKIKQNKQL